MRTVELLLDEAADARVREAWRRLADAGLPSQARHPGSSNRPHLTLAACPELTAPIRWELARTAAALPVPVRFTGVVRFEGRSSVLAWALDNDPVLGTLHRQVWEAVASDSPPGSLNPLHRPGRWRPHITLGRTRRPDAFAGRRVPGLLPAPPATARLVTLRSYDTETGEPEILTSRL
ncbi:2'-5' RNA ligase family protein [Streptomyces sp. LP05-1]|uniref:2'-5' RNA ligase family protein n=1 Tax=Streptomyces pyxinae TaxID=2970734 RepID=A0ABT2CDV2_9ACTN|nr:2'-5' RNA ligase family protein [Streptomyces sp. LP05-1]MCS0634936.1 2'-5' RNA ligase family protein [Streptomyces sp. LP05-1]